MKKLTIICLALTCCLWSCQQETTTTETESSVTVEIETDASIQLPDGFKAAVVVDSVGRARHIAVRDNGDIYVQLRRTKGDRGLVALRDTSGDVRADIIQTFGSHQGTGCRIYNNYLYASSDTEIYRYNLEDDALLPNVDSKTLIAGGFQEQSSHAQKSFTFDDAGNLYVGVGAPSNACQTEPRAEGSVGVDPCPQLEYGGGIWRFDANKPAQTQAKDGLRYASGIRNAVAVTWNPSTNNLFAMQHGRDQLHQLWKDKFTEDQGVELPSEEFYSIEQGDDFGWPYCYFDHLQDKKLLGPEYGGDGEIQGRCEGYKGAILGFPGHMAPNDLLFYTGDQFPARYKNGAFIAFHGSWNRAPQEQKGYFVAFVPMEDGVPSGDWEIFAEGFAGAPAVKSPRDAKHRPCGLAQGPDGSLYVTDDVKGKIWKIMYQ